MLIIKIWTLGGYFDAGGPGSGRRPGGGKSNRVGVKPGKGSPYERMHKEAKTKTKSDYKKLYDQHRKNGFSHEFAQGYAKQRLTPNDVSKSMKVPSGSRSDVGDYPFEP